ncbi:PREDICTED: uncharacterized protein LOC109168889 [Ipomoea nil]|uniref:uncharacterized protein LOC109168889 n=1 Tax=Ipomoea nil TaxID=35883 RepID=UPI000900CC11|nr:PREDICTED: uncharacterized protein LOC109168889 [Ipomoea nil]
MGFDERWANLIMLCVITVEYNILVNGVTGGRVVPTRGSDREILYPHIYSLFVQREATVIKQCLNRYENLSGQKVNFHKSNICFSRNTQEAERLALADCLQVDQAPNFGKYLGLPSFVGRNKKAVFAYVEDKIRQRIGSWNKKLLSQAGKEVLLKSVA